MKRHAIARRWSALRDWWLLVLNRDRLRSGRAIGVLARLCDQAAGDDSKFAPTSWKGLADKRGAGVAEAVKAGCKLVWRNYSPPLPHEKPRPNEVGSGLVVGLAGIQSAITDGELAFGSTSDDDARLITRYAVNEMNGFPNWLHELATAKPGPVADILRACVLGEWQYPADREHVHDVLTDLAWEGQALACLVRSTVMDRLRTGDPAHPAIRDAAVTLVVKTATLPDDDLGRIAAARCRELLLDSAAFSLWLAVCLQVNADQAITILEERLPGCPTADDVVLNICEMLEGDVRRHLSFIAHPDYLRPPALVRLIPLVYRHIRPAEDIDRSDGGTYSATPRDEASRFRSGLLTRLANSDDPTATASLRELSVRAELSTSRDWILHLIDERMVSEADYRAWDPADIRMFARDHETDPRTDAELFRIILNRLTDIKNDVEKSDNSLREEVPRKCEEFVLRRWLARKLNERSRQRYTVPQEGEIDQKQSPDLRAENPWTPPVSIEIKWADQWTIDKLLAGLETQLVGQYLRAHNSRYGIYVLGMDTRKKYWQHSTRGDLTFDQVRALIENRARELTATRGDIADVRVVAVDFRPPPER